MKQIAVIFLLAGFSLSCLASGNDLINCRWKDGRSMSARDCESERRYYGRIAAEEEAHKNRTEDRLARQRLAQEERRASAAEKQAKIDAENKIRAAQYEKEQEEAKKEREKWEQEEAQAEARKKKQCGRDFNAIRIGMTLDRFEACTDGLAFETETTAKGGVIETYHSTFYWIHAQNGRIIAYTRRTR